MADVPDAPAGDVNGTPPIDADAGPNDVGSLPEDTWR